MTDSDLQARLAPYPIGGVLPAAAGGLDVVDGDAIAAVFYFSESAAQPTACESGVGRFIVSKVLAQTAGAVLSLTHEGKTVREGQLVARITAPGIAARSSRMDAEVKRAQTERDSLCETYETDRKLGAAGAITSRQVDMSKRACDAATAALNAARAGSREVGATLRLARAPQFRDGCHDFL